MFRIHNHRVFLDNNRGHSPRALKTLRGRRIRAFIAGFLSSKLLFVGIESLLSLPKVTQMYKDVKFNTISE